MATVLLVEDDVLLRKSLAALVEAEGHEALSAGNGFEAVELIRRGPRRPWSWQRRPTRASRGW